MGVVITGVEPGSIAHRLGVRPGWVLERVAGHQIQDVLDYRFHTTAEKFAIELLTPSAQPFSALVSKEEYEGLGLFFATYLMDEQKSCRNKCIFCFVDQMPKGMRKSLYFKDDDWRMSFLFGNYVTLTNLHERDVERIIAMRLSPVNISVHTTSPDLRVRMMGNPGAGKVLGWLDRLSEAGIRLNTQLVLCPGINDGEELERSLRELTALAPNMQSIAAVPVGLTAHRQGLQSLRPFTREKAGAVLDVIDAFGDDMRERHGQRICYASDEFYLIAGRQIPPPEHYEAFDQLENGVGLCALLLSEFTQAIEDTPYMEGARNISIATGVGAAPFMRDLVARARECFPGLSAQVFAIENDFFGHTVTVSGLVTGADLIGQLRGKELGEALLIPECMLRHEKDVFLDGLGPEDVREALGVPVIPVQVDGDALLEALRPNPKG